MNGLTTKQKKNLKKKLKRKQKKNNQDNDDDNENDSSKVNEVEVEQKELPKENQEIINKENSTSKKKKHIKKGSIGGIGNLPRFNGLLGDDDINEQ